MHDDARYRDDVTSPHHDGAAEAYDSREAYDSALEVAQTAARAYYDTGTLLMPDAEYDAVVERIQATHAVHPDWDDAGVLTEVAAGASSGGDVRHPTPMLSLGKAKTDEQVTDFVRALATPLVVEPKLDGMAIRVEYRDGRLTLAAQRGDGLTGDDMTTQVLRSPGVTGLPARLSRPWTGEVRGEVYMTSADFETANTNRVGAGRPAFVNERNAVAGSLRNVDRTYDTPMTFAAYDITGADVDALDSHLARQDVAASLGLGTSAHLAPASPRALDDATDVLAAIAAIGRARAGLGYPIDGAVIKADSSARRAALGAASRTPRWALAYKFPPDTAFSVLRAIEVGVGRTGRASFRAQIDPVFVGGTTVTAASLHNAPWIVAAGLGLGTRVAVVRAGDVIPRVTAAVDDHPDDRQPWQPPATCPQCDQPWDTSSLLWRCHTPSCSTVGRIAYAASRDCLDVDGLGEEVATALVEANLVSDLADLFDLSAEQIAATRIGTTATGAPRLIGHAVATRIHTGLQHATTQPYNRVITALGIRTLGRSFGRRYATAFPSMRALREASVEALTSVEGVGPERARLHHDGLALMGPIIDRLAAAGLAMEADEPSATPGAALPLTGLKVVVSGSVPGMSRTEAQDAAIRLGASVSGSVSKNTDLLVAGDGAGSKLAKAETLGVRVMTAEDFAVLHAETFG